MEKEKSSGDNKLYSETGTWSFGLGVSEVFESHILKSVPGYEDGHNIISKVSDFFLTDNCRCIEIGCSVGRLTRHIAARHEGKNASFIAVDNVDEMVRKARSLTTDARISFVVADAFDVDFDAAFVCSVFTLQFIPPKIRQSLVNKIYQEMEWGGGFCLFEKVRGVDARFQDILNSVHWEWKLEQGFTDEEIIGKWRSLKGVMEPFSVDGNIEMLRRAGFEDIETVWKWGPFQGFLAIK